MWNIGANKHYLDTIRGIYMGHLGDIGKALLCVTLSEYVIMPDHVHFIVWLDGLVDHAPTLGDVVGAYKSITTVAWIRFSKAAQIDSIGPFWLRNYFERVIRDDDELERMRLYIRDNPHKLEIREQ